MVPLSTENLIQSLVFCYRGWFDKEDDEPLNPDVEKKPSVWMGSVATAPAKPAKGKSTAAAKGARSAVAKGKVSTGS